MFRTILAVNFYYFPKERGEINYKSRRNRKQREKRQPLLFWEWGKEQSTQDSPALLTDTTSKKINHLKPKAILVVVPHR
jgi:hypothetical protein